MTKFLPFYYDNECFFINQKCFFITGKYVAFLTSFFNSSLFKYCFRNNFPELQGGTRELSKIYFDKLPVIEIDNETNKNFKKIITEIQELKNNNLDTKQQEIDIDYMIFDLYELTKNERKSIGFIEIQ